MIHFYLDESGTSQSKDPNKRVDDGFFVLSAVEMPAVNYPEASREVWQLKRRWLPSFEPDEFEIKGRYIRQAQDVYDGWDWPTRLRAFHEVAELIARLPCRIYTVILHRDKLETRRSQPELYCIAFRHLLEPLGRSLVEQNQPGMLLLDARTDTENKQLVHTYRDWEKQQDEQVRFIGFPWFGRSEFHAGIQLADIAAYFANLAALEDYAAQREAEEKATALVRHRSPLLEAYQKFLAKVTLLSIPSKRGSHDVS